MNERRWIPADWVDEIVTGLADSPDAFLKRDGRGWLLLHPAEGDEEHVRDDDDDADWRVRPIDAGEVVLFCWTQSFGEARLVVHPDRSWRCEGTFPPEATHFWLPFDVDTLASSIAELVDGPEDGSGGLEPGVHVIGAYTWSEPIPFSVEVLESGAARFVEAVRS